MTHIVDNKRVATPKDAVDILKSCMKDIKSHHNEKEQAWVIGLDYQNYAMYIDLVSLGCSNQTTVSLRDVFRLAISEGCSKIFFLHTHTSYETNPSLSDDDMTKRLLKAGKILDVSLLDHVIYSPMSDAWFSYKSAKRLKWS